MFKTNRITTLIGIVFILFGVSAIINSIVNGSPYAVLWFCYIGLILLGIGVLMKNTLLILSQGYILIIPDIVWTLDFISYLLMGSSVFGISDYFFSWDNRVGQLIALQHLFTVPLLWVALSFMELKKNKAWVCSMIQITVMYFITRLITPAELNINCVYRACGNFVSGLPYTSMWFVAAFLMVGITAVIIDKMKVKK